MIKKGIVGNPRDWFPPLLKQLGAYLDSNGQPGVLISPMINDPKASNLKGKTYFFGTASNPVGGSGIMIGEVYTLGSSGETDVSPLRVVFLEEATGEAHENELAVVDCVEEQSLSDDETTKLLEMLYSFIEFDPENSPFTLVAMPISEDAGVVNLPGINTLPANRTLH